MVYLSFEDTEEKFESHFLLFKWARGYHLYLFFFVALARALYNIMRSDDLRYVIGSYLFVVIIFILCLLNVWWKTSNVFISISGRIIFWGLVIVNCIEAWELWIDPCPNTSSSICEMILNSTFPFKTTFVLICSSFSSTWVFPLLFLNIYVYESFWSVFPLLFLCRSPGKNPSLEWSLLWFLLTLCYLNPLKKSVFLPVYSLFVCWLWDGG